LLLAIALVALFLCVIKIILFIYYKQYKKTKVMKTKNKIQAGISIGMIRLALASFFIAIVFASCSKDEIAPSSNNNQSSDATAMRARQPDNTVQQITSPGNAMLTMAHIGKGSVQSYEAKLFSNGIVELKAISNLPFKGTIRYYISQKDVQAVRDVFMKNGFSRLAAEYEYPGRNVYPINITSFATCSDCDILSIKTVKDHTVMIPKALANIKAAATKLLQIERHIFMPTGDLGAVDGTASN
jgi:hypothetical protein